MAHDVAFAAFLAFALGSAVAMLMYARRMKHRAPWLFLALIFATAAGLWNYYRDPESLTENLRIFYMMVPFGWIIAVFLLSRSNYEDRLEKQYAELSALNELARSYIASDELSEAARSSLLKVAQAFNADGGHVLTLNWLRRRIDIFASFGEIPGSALELVEDLNRRLATGELSMETMAKGQAIVRELGGLRETMRREDGFSSLLGRPIMFHRRATGMFVLYSRRPARMTKQDEAIFALVAFELGFWLEQVKNIASLRRLSETQKGLLDVTLAMQQEIASEGELLSYVLERLNRLIPSQTVSLYLFNRTKRLLFPAAALGKDAEEIMAEGEFPTSEGGFAGAILSSGRAEIIADSSADGRGRVVKGTSDEPASGLVVPLLSQGRAIGVLELHRPVTETFTRQELDIASLFAQQAAAAIENADLLSVMEREKERTELLLDLLSHDIANLNTPLMSYFDMLFQIDGVKKEIRTIIERAFPQVEKINELIQRVRKLSKADLDEPEALREVDLIEMLESAGAAVRSAFPSRRIELSIRAAGESACHALAGEMLDEVFYNILHNAAKFAPEEDARVDIEIEPREIGDREYCFVMVKDYGAGIADIDKRRIFEKEKPLEASIARGYGIGLATCRRFVEKYGGELWVEDRVKGDHTRGTCFVVKLPMARRPARK